MGGHGFGLLGMSVWRRLAFACLLLSVVWLSYFVSVAEDEGFRVSGEPAAPAAAGEPVASAPAGAAGGPRAAGGRP